MIKAGGFENMPAMPFNMAALWFLELDRLQMRKYEAIISRDAVSYYCLVDCIYTHVFMKIPEKDRKDIADHLKKVYNKVLATARSSEAQREYNTLSGFELCKELDRRLILILNDQKLFFPDINFHLGLDKVSERFGLKENDT